MEPAIIFLELIEENMVSDGVTQPQSNGLAIAALVLGICSVALSFAFGGLLGVLGLIFGIIALKKNQSKGMALTGIITGAVGILIGLIFLVIFSIAIALGVQEGQQNSEVQSNASNALKYIEVYSAENDVYPNFEQAQSYLQERGITVVAEGEEQSDTDISYTPCFGEGGIVWYWDTTDDIYLSYEAGDTSTCEN